MAGLGELAIDPRCCKAWKARAQPFARFSVDPTADSAFDRMRGFGDYALLPMVVVLEGYSHLEWACMANSSALEILKVKGHWEYEFEGSSMRLAMVLLNRSCMAKTC